MKKIIILIISFLIIFVGCSSEKEEVIKDDSKIENPNNEISIDEQTEDNSKETDETRELKEDETYAPLTGEIIKKKNVDRRVLAVMLDNHFKARPQSGLAKADIVYEGLAEGRITRFMALFQSEYPDYIGPVRSARPYFITKALELNSFYTHVGGSPQAFIDLDKLGVYDIDALSCQANTFWRESHKNIPHNMYSSAQKIIAEGERKNYPINEEIDFLNFYKKDTKINGLKGDIIRMQYKEPTIKDSVGYTSEYRYNPDEKHYIRYTNGEKYLDEKTQDELLVKNVIVQYAKTTVYDDKGRRKMDLIGQGKGLYFTNGEYIEIEWKKKDRRDLTRFYTKSGEEIKLNPGKTWIQLVPLSLQVEVK